MYTSFLFIRRIIGALNGDNMSIRNRYDIARKHYNNTAILVLKKRKLYTYNKDNLLVDFKKINTLKKLHINYIILDNLEVIKKEYEDNKYEEYYLKDKLNNILDNILIKERRNIENE